MTAPQPTILAATGYKPLLSLLERAVQGSGMAVMQVAQSQEAVEAALASSNASLVAVHESTGKSDWLDLVRALKRLHPEVRVIAFGESGDVGVVAKGIVHGVRNYMPMSSCSTPLQIRMIIEEAITGKEVLADSIYGRVKAMLPVGPMSNGRYRCPSGKSYSHEEAIKQCVSLGLTAEETSRFLNIAEGDTRKLERSVQRKVSTGPLLQTKQLVVTGLVLLVVLAALNLVGGKKGKHFVPVSGTVTVEGKPLSDVLVYFSKNGGSHLSSGKTDAAGRYRLSTLQDNDGAEDGTHIVWLGLPPRVRIHTDMNDPQYAEKMVRLMEEGAAEQKAEKEKADAVVPSPYRDMRSSPLRAEIKGGKPMSVDLEIKK